MLDFILLKDFLNFILELHAVKNKKRERKQRLKVSKIALYNIFSN